MISTLRRLRQEAAKCKASLDYIVKQADHEVKQERDAGKTRNAAVAARHKGIQPQRCGSCVQSWTMERKTIGKRSPGRED